MLDLGLECVAIGGRNVVSVIIGIHDADTLLSVVFSRVLYIVGGLIPACGEVVVKDQVQKRSKDAALGDTNISSGERCAESGLN